MLTAWIIISVILGLSAMFAELRKGSDLPTAVMGGLNAFVLWPLVVVLFLLCVIPFIIWGIVGD